MESQTISTVDDALIEVQIPANAFAELISIEIGPAEGTDPVAEVQELALFSTTAAGTGGTALTENVLNGEGTIVGVALRNLTAPGAGLVEWYATAFNARVGWIYEPVPEARYVSAAGAQDNFGFYFPTVPDAGLVLSATIIWGEVG
jgi:hypothetical protein